MACILLCGAACREAPPDEMAHVDAERWRAGNQPWDVADIHPHPRSLLAPADSAMRDAE